MTGKAAPMSRTYRDSVLDRTCTRLLLACETPAESDRLRVEYAVLNRYYNVYVQGDMMGTISSVDASRDVVDQNTTRASSCSDR